MRARRGTVLGWTVVAAYAAAIALVSIEAVIDGPGDARPTSDTRDAAAQLVAAWERSREATFVTVGTYERRSEVTGASIRSEDVLAQRPPRRLHRQLGGVEGRDDDRLLLCPAPPPDANDPAPCQLGAPGPTTYDAAVAREVAGLRALTGGDDPLYAVEVTDPGCFSLELRRSDPRAPFGVAASFCFDPATGAPVAHRVEHEGGIVEVLVVTSIRTEVTDDDLTP